MIDIFNIICWLLIGIGVFLISHLIKDQAELIEENEHRKCTAKDYREIIINLYKGEEFYYEEESK